MVGKKRQRTVRSDCLVNQPSLRGLSAGRIVCAILTLALFQGCKQDKPLATRAHRVMDIILMSVASGDLEPSAQESVYEAVMEVLGNQGDLRARTKVLRARAKFLKLDNYQSVIRFASGKFSDAPAESIPMDDWVHLVNSDVPKLRRSAFWALMDSKLDIEAAIRILVTALEHKDSDVRADAANCLSCIWDVVDPHGLFFVLALRRIRPPAYSRLRKFDQGEIAGIHRSARIIVPALKEALKDRDKDAREAAAAALKKIQAAPATQEAKR